MQTDSSSRQQQRDNSSTALTSSTRSVSSTAPLRLAARLVCAMPTYDSLEGGWWQAE